MRVQRMHHWVWIPIISLLFWGCAGKEVQLPEEPKTGWTERAVTDEELEKLSEKDPELTYSSALEILARLNIKARYYIKDDIKSGNPLKVPNDFSLYKGWTPLPRFIEEVADIPRFILIIKDIPFLGWYEKGTLVGDTHICIGKQEKWTKAGLYKVREKDIDHISQSYRNAYGQPAPMPWALRIYGRVWIHAGDIVDGYCSRGCINLPMMPAKLLFHWAKVGTTVLIVESLDNLEEALETHSRVLASKR